MRSVAKGEGIRCYSASMPADLSGRPPVRRPSAQRTPAGVWVIVGLAAFFALGAFGVGAFIVIKSLTERVTATASEKSSATVSQKQSSPTISAQPSATVSVTPAVIPASGSATVTNSAAESEETRKEVLNRVDLMRNLSQKEKDQFYAQVERARGFRKLAVISFASGRSVATGAQADELLAKLNDSDAKSLLEDPTVVVLLVGYADTQGEETKNLEVSRSRAESLEKQLSGKLKLKNIVHSVGMGGQDLFDKTNREKNRVVEVWAVQP
jgi:outer membrane protein OmpA-like peptidoglycan-associated protein